MSDPRLTPANGRVAHVSLKGQVQAERFVDGTWRQVADPVVDILHAPDGNRLRQALYGEQVLVLDASDGHAFVQLARDRYVGYVRLDGLADVCEPTHWVSAPSTHLYPEADLKTHEICALSFGSFVTITKTGGRFCETTNGHFVPACHLTTVGEAFSDPVVTADKFLGTPYLWGANGRAGIDCSGLVQAALLACGIACPGDSDLQEAALGRPIPDSEDLRRGDLLFWKGHVAMCVDAKTMIHSNAHAMAVVYESIDDAIDRISRQGDGPVTARKRL